METRDSSALSPFFAGSCEMEGAFLNSAFFSVLSTVLSVAACVATWIAAVVAVLTLALVLVPGVSAGEVVVREGSEDDGNKGESLVMDGGGKVDGLLLVGIFMEVELSSPCSGGSFFVVVWVRAVWRRGKLT